MAFPFGKSVRSFVDDEGGFLDFAGSRLDLGGGGGDHSMPTWTPTGTNAGRSVSIDITTQPTVISPAPIFLEAINLVGFRAADEATPSGGIYDHTAHEVVYRWRIVSGPTLLPATAPLHMWSKWNDPNVTYKKKAAFCLNIPGTYVIEVLAVDRDGNWATAQTGAIVVQDPESITWANTFVFASDGVFAGAPAGTQFTSLSALSSAVQGASGGLTRIMWKAGEENTGVQVSTGSGRLDFMGRWGSGANPRLRPDEFNGTNMIQWSTNDSSTQVTVDGVDIEGYWDADTETGGLGGGSVLYWRDRNTAVIKCFHDMKIEHCEKVETSSLGADVSFMFAHVDRHGHQDYSFSDFGEPGGKVAYLWCSGRQKQNALSGISGPKQGIANQHGNWRFKQRAWVVMDGCYGYARNDWSGSAANPVLRCSTTTEPDTDKAEGSAYCVGRCIFVGGYQIINGEGENLTAWDTAGNYNFGPLMLVGTSSSNSEHVSWHKGGTTFENMLHVQPNVDSARQTLPSQFYNLGAGNHRNTNIDEPVRVRNCSGADLRNDTNGSNGAMSMTANLNAFNNAAEENCVIVAPNRSSPSQSHTNLDLLHLAAEISTLYPGIQFNYEYYTASSPADVPHDGSFLIPYASALRVIDTFGNGPNTQTDQAYWQARTGTKGKLRFGALYDQHNGDFELEPEATNLRIRNRSGETMSGGALYFQPDRSDVIDTELPPISDANPNLLPSVRQLAGSSAINPGGADQYALTDIECGLRSLTQPDAGAWQGVAA